MAKPIKKTDQKKAWAKHLSNFRRINDATYRSDLDPDKLFLIICEGMNTEPEYFKSFPITNAEIKSFGTGTSKTALVKLITEQFLEDHGDYEIWAVFDMDRKEDQLVQQQQDYNQAIALAHKNGIKTAYSNDAFELWFVLHYQFIDAKLPRESFYQILSNRWNCNYQKIGKNLSFCRGIYDRLQSDSDADIQQALKHADRLFKHQKHLPFSDQNPCTTVYQLVKHLNKYLQ